MDYSETQWTLSNRLFLLRARRKGLNKASQISFIFLLIGFVFQRAYFLFGKPVTDRMQAMITSWMAFVFGSKGISILVYQREM